MDECSSLLQCGVWLLDRWGAREGDVLDRTRHRRSDGDRLVSNRHRRSDGDRLVSNVEIKAILVPCNAANESRFSNYLSAVGVNESAFLGTNPRHYFRIARDPLRMANSRQLSDQAIARAGPSHNYHVELLYQRRTRRARSVFQRLALPTSLSISNGICSG